MNLFRRLFGQKPKQHDTGQPRSPDLSSLGEALLSFIHANTWSESQRIVEAHPELLSNDATNLLVGLIISKDEHSELRRELEVHYSLLLRCRTIGVASAFRESITVMQQDDDQLRKTILAFIRASNWGDSQQIVESHPELLSDTADHLLIELARGQDDEDRCNMVEQHRHLLQRCREIGIEQAFNENMLTNAPLDDLMRLSLVHMINALLAANTENEVRQIIETHPLALHEDADVLLAELSERAANQPAANKHIEFTVAFIEGLRSLLRRCREVGITQALDERNIGVG